MSNFKSSFIRINLVVLLLLNFSNLNAQIEVFKSNLIISDDDLSSFYSSISSDSTQVYFNSNDYYLHAFDKKTKNLSWSFYLANKSNTSPKLNKNSVFVEQHIGQNYDRCIQLDKKNGDTIQTLRFNSLQTNPIFKDNVVYCAAISPGTGGAILAYDLEKNKIIWERFIAHGVSTQPYFLKNKIVASAESDNWFEIDYNGILKDTLCKNKASMFVNDIPCIKNFRYLTHDEKEIDEPFLIKHLGETENLKFFSNQELTVIMGSENLIIIGNNKKIKNKINFLDLKQSFETESNRYKGIIKIEGNDFWFFFENNLVSYDLKTEKAKKIINLSKWKVHQLILENDNSVAWIISKNDGQLYGIKL